jgi:hypothetical protein
MGLLDENTRSRAIDVSCETTQQMLPALEQTIEHQDMTEDLNSILSTLIVDIVDRG